MWHKSVPFLNRCHRECTTAECLPLKTRNDEIGRRSRPKIPSRLNLRHTLELVGEVVAWCQSMEADRGRHRLIRLRALCNLFLPSFVTTYFRNLKGFSCLTSANFFVFTLCIYPTKENNFKISKPKICKNKYRNLFSCRGINCWNACPNDIVNAFSLNIFKSKLNKI